MQAAPRPENCGAASFFPVGDRPGNKPTVAVAVAATANCCYCYCYTHDHDRTSPPPTNILICLYRLLALTST